MTEGSVRGIENSFEDLALRGIAGVTNFGGRSLIVVSCDGRIGTSELECGSVSIGGCESGIHRSARLNTASSTAKCAPCSRILFISSTSALSLASILDTSSSKRLWRARSISSSCGDSGYKAAEALGQWLLTSTVGGSCRVCVNQDDH